MHLLDPELISQSLAMSLQSDARRHWNASLWVPEQELKLLKISHERR